MISINLPKFVNHHQKFVMERVSGKTILEYYSNITIVIQLKYNCITLLNTKVIQKCRLEKSERDEDGEMACCRRSEGSSSWGNFTKKQLNFLIYEFCTKSIKLSNIITLSNIICFYLLEFIVQNS